MTAAFAKHAASATVVAILAGGAVARPAMATPAAAGPARTTSLYGNLPASFEANAGQVDRAVEFLSRGAGSTLFLTRGEAVVTLGGAGRPDGAVVRMRLAGRARRPRGVGLAPQVTRSNYLLGNDPRRWHTGIANYSQVRYPEVYSGIDLLYHGSRRQLELDFVVAPGADPGRIRLAFAGTPAIGAVEVGGQGELILRTAHGKLVQPAPVVYQERQGDRPRASIAGRYVLVAAPAARRGGEPAGVEVGFAVGPYDRSRTLVIDPVQVYSTFLGGNLDDEGNGIAVDGAGNAYVTGQTFSTTFPGVGAGSIQPANGGNVDVFVTKINAAGTAIVYSTFLGGTGDELGFAIAVDGSGNAHVAGATSLSTTFPGITAGSLQPANGGGFDAFVTKINAAGTAVVYSTFLGGSGDDYGNGIAVDAAGNAFVTGSTASTNFPGVTGSSIQPAYGGDSTDGFVTEIDPAGAAIVFSTYLGGSGRDVANGIALNAVGDVYVTGTTQSAAFPGVSGSSIQPSPGGGGDAFVTKIGAQLSFYTVTPCRVFDTRGGTPMSVGETRVFQVGGVCGIPAGARLVSANLTVVWPQGAGFLTLFPGDVVGPALTSTLNFSAGQVRANNAMVLLAGDGSGTVKVLAAFAPGVTDVLLDVNGYFQ